MFSYLKALAARLMGSAPFLAPPPASPEDPHARVRQPLQRGPGGKSAAVAVAEPDEEKAVDLYSPARRP